MYMQLLKVHNVHRINIFRQRLHLQLELLPCPKQDGPSEDKKQKYRDLLGTYRYGNSRRGKKPTIAPFPTGRNKRVCWLIDWLYSVSRRISAIFRPYNGGESVLYVTANIEATTRGVESTRGIVKVLGYSLILTLLKVAQILCSTM